MKKIFPFIAPEGYPFIGIALTLTIGIIHFFGPLWSLLPFAGLIFVIWFFRDPLRTVPPISPEIKGEPVISPADGKIVHIGNANEPRILKKDLQKISIFMSPLNVHVNRSPISGKVLETHYHPGKFFNASLDKASLNNEANAVLMESNRGIKMVFVQIAGFIARRILCYAKPGDTLEGGERIGMIRFGSRVDIYLPENAKIMVELRNKVKAGETILGYIPD